MPKKTKKEKIIAELRRKIAEKDGAKVVSSASGFEDEETKEKFHYVPTPTLITRPTTQNSPSPVSQASTIYIKKDLLKTLLLSLFALSFEIVIYWAWSR